MLSFAANNDVITIRTERYRLALCHAVRGNDPGLSSQGLRPRLSIWPPVKINMPIIGDYCQLVVCADVHCSRAQQKMRAQALFQPAGVFVPHDSGRVAYAFGNQSVGLIRYLRGAGSYGAGFHRGAGFQGTSLDSTSFKG